ncbi:MAG: hypothetical protein EXR08_09345 [Alphaproteobacteria bacterium]|nr:hypothetical protein [Alphaproteobacteria bacterium]
MKITFNIDCTAEEARSFFGLPDVAPMQDRMLQEMEAHMRKNLGAMDMEGLFRNFMTGAGTGMERWQEMFRQVVKTGMDSN